MQDSNGILKEDQQLQTIKVQYQTHFYAITANASDQNVYVVKRRFWYVEKIFIEGFFIGLMWIIDFVH